jgi:2-isopropylmalate synthase
VEFSSVVQKHADATGTEVTADQIWTLFSREYLERAVPVRYVEHHLFEAGDKQGVRLTVETGGRRAVLVGTGNGPIDAVVQALALPVRVQSYEERSIGEGANARAAAMVELAIDGVPGSAFGVGIHPNIVTASVLAILSGVNRVAAREGSGIPATVERVVAAAG